MSTLRLSLFAVLSLLLFLACSKEEIEPEYTFVRPPYLKTGDLVDFSKLRYSPKWVVGYSDVTMLHLALYKPFTQPLNIPVIYDYPFGYSHLM